MPTTARKHQLQSSLVYHIYNRSHRSSRIFEKHRDYGHFISLLIDMKKKTDLKIYHWAIMGNHYHLCVELVMPEMLSKCISGLQRAYTHYYNKTRNVYGTLWQGRFKSQPIESEHYLLACGRYIERNPARAGLVNEAVDYIYSSASFYGRGYRDEITDESPAYSSFGNTIFDRQRNYVDYLKKFEHEEEQLFSNAIKPVGSALFLTKLVKEGGHYRPRRKGASRRCM